MAKRGQFYIIAAAIIAVLLVGLAATINYAITSATPIRFYDLSKEYNLETAKVIDYGVYQKYTPEIDIGETIKNFTEQFYINAVIKDQDIEIILVYGNSSNATGFSYTKNETTFINAQNIATEAGGESTSTISYEAAQSKFSKRVRERLKSTVTPIPAPPGEKVKIKTSENVTYEVKLEKEQNFYFIIMTKKETGEVTVATK